MARNKLTVKAYINIDGENYLWYEIDADHNVTWHLPEDKSKAIEQKMLKNISEHMSMYCTAHPESSLLNEL